MNKTKVLERIQDRIDDNIKNYKAQPDGSIAGIQGFALVYGLEIAQRIVELLDEPEESKLVVIPQFVADWIEECKKHGKSLSECLVTFNFNHEKAFNWTNAIRLDREEIIARAWLDGYAIEKEILYKVLFPMQKKASGEKLVKYTDSKRTTIRDEYYYARNLSDEFTEEEIQKINPDYMKFAVPLEKYRTEEI